MLRCSFCGQYPTIKSNKAIHEELSRFCKPFDTIAIPSCPNQDCPNHHIDIEKGKTHYHLFGRTDLPPVFVPLVKLETGAYFLYTM